LVRAGAIFFDVTDLVEFLQRQESVSGVQRVVAETVPLLIDQLDQLGEHSHHLVILDRHRGEFVELDQQETEVLVIQGARATSKVTNRSELATQAQRTIERAHSAPVVNMGRGDILVFLGALWINDSLMLAAREAQAKGVKLIDLLYDLTPVMQTGHTAGVNKLFDRYLTLISQTATRVPAISESSRRDFEAWFQHRNHGEVVPGGAATGLPCGITPEQFPEVTGPDSPRPWPRDYVLFVGTIESRKNHIFAFNVWKTLIQDRGAENVPDLVCIGRLGWHANEFLKEYTFTKGLDGKVAILTGSITDAELASFYAHAEFTFYPSNYEGWGLPVSESIAFGKIPIVADNSSLREAGEGNAIYFGSNNLESAVNAIREQLDNPLSIKLNPNHNITWSHVARTLNQEIHEARNAEERPTMFPEIELGHEYMLAVAQPEPDGGFADQYLNYLNTEGLTPLLKQPRGERDFEVADSAVIGTFGSPQTWGNEIRPGRRADFRFTRPADGELTLLISTRSMPGTATIEAITPTGPLHQQVYLGSVITIPVGSGAKGEPVQATLLVKDATDSIEGFLGIRSFIVLGSNDKDTEIIALKAAADSLKAELEFMQSTRSWKVTAPLRKMKGRGSQ
jgi:glycosyltransferase involved in cell wall biosynthesis